MPIPSHTYGAVLASSPSRLVGRFNVADVLGKGMALHTDPLAGAIGSNGDLCQSREWVVDIVDFERVRRTF